MTIEALDASDSPVTLRFSDSAFIDSASNFYDNRIDQAALFTNQAFTGAVLQGSRSGYGETALINTDGGLNYLADYALDGRVLVLSLVGDSGSITKYLQATVQQVRFDDARVGIVLRDPQANIDLPHPMAIYAGTNVLPAGTEGTADDIKGAKKPKVFGKVRSATPVQVNTSKLIYQASSLSCSIVNVYDRGAAITGGAAYPDLATLESTAPSAGQYRAFQGYFRLGSTPAGTVTCDADATAGAGSVFVQIATEVSNAVNAADVTIADAVGEVGIYLVDDTSTSAMLDLIANSIGAYWFFDNSGMIRLLPLSAPASPTLTINPYEVLSISRDSTGAGSNGLPVYRVRMLADKVETVQEDLAGSVPASTVARLSLEYREAIAESATTKTRHPLAEELLITSCLRSLAVAQTVADTLLALLSVRRDRLQVNANIDGQFDIGTEARVITNKLGYAAGRNLKVLGYTIDGKKRQVTLNLWG